MNMSFELRCESKDPLTFTDLTDDKVLDISSDLPYLDQSHFQVGSVYLVTVTGHLLRKGMQVSIRRAGA